MEARNKHASLEELKSYEIKESIDPKYRSILIEELERDDPLGKRAHELAKLYRP